LHELQIISASATYVEAYFLLSLAVTYSGPSLSHSLLWPGAAARRFVMEGSRTVRFRYLSVGEHRVVLFYRLPNRSSFRPLIFLYVSTRRPSIVTFYSIFFGRVFSISFFGRIQIASEDGWNPSPPSTKFIKIGLPNGADTGPQGRDKISFLLGNPICRSDLPPNYVLPDTSCFRPKLHKSDASVAV